YPAVRYDDANRAIDWLKTALGFEERQVYRDGSGVVEHAELRLAGNLIMLGTAREDAYVKSPRSLGAVTSSIYIALETPADVDQLHARATKKGAEIIRELCDTDYGSHEFGVRDLEGHLWSFGTYRPQAAS